MSGPSARALVGYWSDLVEPHDWQRLTCAPMANASRTSFVLVSINFERRLELTA